MARSSDRSFLIALFKDKTFQTREVRRVLGLSLLYLTISTVLLAIFYQQMLGQLVAGDSPLLFVSEDVSLINEQVPALSAVLGRWVLVMLAINVVVTSVIGVYIMRKLSQPMLAIKRALSEMGEGKLDTTLRSTDTEEFAEIAEAFNAARACIQEKIREAKDELDHLQDQPEASREDLAMSIKNCAVILDYFETTDIDGNRTARAAQ